MKDWLDSPHQRDKVSVPLRRCLWYVQYNNPQETPHSHPLLCVECEMQEDGEKLKEVEELNYQRVILDKRGKCEK